MSNNMKAYLAYDYNGNQAIDFLFYLGVWESFDSEEEKMLVKECGVHDNIV